MKTCGVGRTNLLNVIMNKILPDEQTNRKKNMQLCVIFLLAHTSHIYIIVVEGYLPYITRVIVTSSVGIPTGYEPGFYSWLGQKILSTPQCPERIRSPPKLLMFARVKATGT
jgi:hypothetical protein